MSEVAGDAVSAFIDERKFSICHHQTQSNLLSLELNPSKLYGVLTIDVKGYVDFEPLPGSWIVVASVDQIWAELHCQPHRSTVWYAATTPTT